MTCVTNIASRSKSVHVVSKLNLFSIYRETPKEIRKKDGTLLGSFPFIFMCVFFFFFTFYRKFQFKNLDYFTFVFSVKEIFTINLRVKYNPCKNGQICTRTWIVLSSCLEMMQIKNRKVDVFFVFCLNFRSHFTRMNTSPLLAKVFKFSSILGTHDHI